MKIISGKYKGRNILGFDINGTRPTMDRVKESLFAIIQNYIKDSIVLDLFSGSGNLALESMSEGAKEIYLVDKNKKAYKTILDNLNNFNIKEYHLLNTDYKKALEYYNENNISFDIIFLDPPYDTNYIEESIKLITEYNLVKENGIIVCENNRLERIVYSNNYEKIKEKKYGDKWVVILKKI